MGGVLLAGLAVWAGQHWIDSNSYVAPHSKTAALSPGAPAVKAAIRPVFRRELDAESGVLNNRLRELDRQLEAARRDRAVLHQELANSRSENRVLRQASSDRERQIRQLLEQARKLRDQLQQEQEKLAALETHRESANTEQRVIYNITNIPVGSHVSLQRIEADRDSLAGTPAGERIESDTVTEQSLSRGPVLQIRNLPYGPDPEDVNAEDPYRKYRDTDGDQTGWKGDSFLADAIEDGLHEAPLALPEEAAVLKATDENVVSTKISVPLPTIVQVPDSDGSVRQEPFFGPAPDSHVDRVSPGMAELPASAESPLAGTE